MESKTDQYIESLISEVSELNDKNKQLLEEIDILKDEQSLLTKELNKYTEVNEENKKLKSELILSEQKVKLNYNSIIELQSELKDKDIDLQHYKKMASNNNHF